MIAHHTTPRNERIVVFENHDEFESINPVTLDNVNGEPLVIATRTDVGWAITIYDSKTQIGYPDLRIQSPYPAGNVGNICLALANGVVAMRTEPSTVVSI